MQKQGAVIRCTLLPVGENSSCQGLTRHVARFRPQILSWQSPVDFIAKLAALVPKPGVNLTRHHGVFAPNSKHRVWVTPAKQSKGNWIVNAEQPAQRHVAMSWAQRLKRVFNIDVEACRVCGAAARVIDWIEDPVVIRKILNHLQGCRS